MHAGASVRNVLQSRSRSSRLSLTTYQIQGQAGLPETDLKPRNERGWWCLTTEIASHR